MSTKRPSDHTIDFYDRNAQVYTEETLDVDMEGLYESFLGIVPKGAHILDAGCGSGRDSLAFKRRGYTVNAIDASPELARRASELIGQVVEVVRFQDLSYEDEFDGVWACASLLHVPQDEVDEVFLRFSRALKPDGIWYMSFKVGENEENRGGRLFKDHTEQSFIPLVGRRPELEVVNLWRTVDRRPHRASEEWLNAIVRKK